jgi:hypothetical protein
MACSPLPHITRRGLAFNADDDALLHRVRDQLAQQVGRASYAAAILYGLRLADAHLSAGANPPVPLAPTPPTDPRQR